MSPPTVETANDAADALPILVTVLDAAIEPDVTVAPAGKLRITLMNQGARPHDLTIVRDGDDGQRGAAAAGHGVACQVAITDPGDSNETVCDLAPGRYLFKSSDVSNAGAPVELTVQPSDAN